MMLQVSEHCSACCSHCPFSKNERWFSVQEVLQQAKLSKSGYVTLTGGEPLEHPEIRQIVSEIQQLEIPYRLATGGHVDLAPFESLFASPLFMGLSLGTDVISSRNSSIVFKAMWKENLNYIFNRGLPWSITVTLGQGFDFSEVQRFFGSKRPNFIMLNNLDHDQRAIEAFKEKLKMNMQWRNISCL